MIEIKRLPPPLLTYEIKPDPRLHGYMVACSNTNLMRLFASIEAAEAYVRKAAARQQKPAQLIYVDREGYAERRITI